MSYTDKWTAIDEVMMSDFSDMLDRKFEEAKGDLTRDPITAEEFFDELEEKAAEVDPVIAHMINFYAVRLYGTMPIHNNPYLEIWNDD